MSADYLKMENLSTYAMNFVIKNFNIIIQKSIDLSIISKNIYKNLCQHLEDLTIEQVDDKKHYRFKSKLYMQKLEQFFTEDANKLNICLYCSRLFSWKHVELLKCTKAKLFIDYHGNAISVHMEGTPLNMPDFVNYVHSKGKFSWRTIYWKIWGYTILFYCTRCDRYFRGTEVNQCLYHSQSPIYLYGTNSCRYPCCNALEKKFQTGNIEKAGCCGKIHEPLLKTEADIQVYN